MLALIVAVVPAVAHRLDEYLQAALVEIQPDEIRLRIKTSSRAWRSQQRCSR